MRELLLYLDGRVSGPEELTSDHWNRYFEARERIYRQIWGRLMGGSYRANIERALRLFLRFLADRGMHTQIALPDRKDPKDVPGYRELLAEYEGFLINHRGVRPATVSYYTNQAGLLCLWMIEAGVTDWEKVTPGVLYDHIRRAAQRLGYNRWKPRPRRFAAQGRATLSVNLLAMSVKGMLQTAFGRKRCASSS